MSEACIGCPMESICRDLSSKLETQKQMPVVKGDFVKEVAAAMMSSRPSVQECKINNPNTCSARPANMRRLISMIPWH